MAIWRPTDGSCPACSGLIGLSYPDEVPFDPPLHPNCDCYLEADSDHPVQLNYDPADGRAPYGADFALSYDAQLRDFYMARARVLVELNDRPMNLLEIEAAMKALAEGRIHALTGLTRGEINGVLQDWAQDASGIIRDAEGIFDEHRTSWPGDSSVLFMVLAGMYAVTQEELSKAGANAITVYRGVREDDPEDEFLPGILDPLEAWTLDRGVAEDYVSSRGYVEAITLPASRFLSIPATGFGSAQAAEVVVIRGGGQSRWLQKE